MPLRPSASPRYPLLLPFAPLLLHGASSVLASSPPRFLPRLRKYLTYSITLRYYIACSCSSYSRMSFLGQRPPRSTSRPAPAHCPLPRRTAPAASAQPPTRQILPLDRRAENAPLTTRDRTVNPASAAPSTACKPHDPLPPLPVAAGGRTTTPRFLFFRLSLSPLQSALTKNHSHPLCNLHLRKGYIFFYKEDPQAGSKPAQTKRFDLTCSQPLASI